MNPQEGLLAVLAAVPGKKIVGKKRLQKLVYLLKCAGADINADFRLMHYGPYSGELANTADLLCLTGYINEKLEPLGVYGTYQAVYSLAPTAQVRATLTPKYRELLKELNNYSTLALEVASTIRLFQREGSSLRAAIDKTKSMKPTKTVKPVMDKAVEVLSKLQ